MENQKLFKLIEKLNFKGISFVSLKSYTSDKTENTEVADVLINVGISYESMKAKDLETLQLAKLNAKEYTNDNFGVALIEQAIDEKIKSIVSPNENRSKGQTEAFIVLNNGVKYCPNTDSLLISGTVVRKTVIVEGIYKTVNSRALTLAKKHLDKVLDLRLSKIRYYKVSNVGSVKVTGETIEFDN
jgi:hypothetical protein